ncbi:MAG: hypothetical protein H6R25_2169 [Proteobacteria bacterium]|nr:hypothetical protein [Pseudomonadota bacterium]
MAGNKWQNRDELQEKMALLILENKTCHSLGTHHRRVDIQTGKKTLPLHGQRP